MRVKQILSHEVAEAQRRPAVFLCYSCAVSSCCLLVELQCRPFAAVYMKSSMHGKAKVIAVTLEMSTGTRPICICSLDIYDLYSSLMVARFPQVYRCS